MLALQIGIDRVIATAYDLSVMAQDAWEGVVVSDLFPFFLTSQFNSGSQTCIFIYILLKYKYNIFINTTKDQTVSTLFFEEQAQSYAATVCTGHSFFQLAE